MDINEMINEWYKGCSHNNAHPIECKECTLALINAIDSKAFKDDTNSKCRDVVLNNGVAGIAMAAGLAAQHIEQRKQLVRARNEYINNR